MWRGMEIKVLVTKRIANIGWRHIQSMEERRDIRQSYTAYHQKEDEGNKPSNRNNI